MISFSHIVIDARVLREISVVAKHGKVTTIGYGPKPPGVDEHIEVSPKKKTLPQTPLGVLKLALHLHKSSELAAPSHKEGYRLLKDRKFDAIIANEARAMPLAFALAKGAPVWADLHEWAPGERTHIFVWRVLVAPFMDYVCRKFLPLCAASTTVSPEIGKLYERDYGVAPRMLFNAAKYADLQPTESCPDGVIRLVHCGGAVAGRHLEAMIEAVKELGEGYTLDFYLVPANDGGAYLDELKAAAQGCDRIRFLDPVPPEALAKTMNPYDVGVFWIPPTHMNARYTLPNKFFYFVQSRLAIAIGPSVEMVNLLKEYRLGVVSDDFSVQSIVRTLRGLTPEAICQYKQAADAAAKPLSFEEQAKVIDEIMGEMLEGAGRE